MEYKYPLSKTLIDDDDINAVVEVLRSSKISRGEKVNEFEKVFAEFTGAKYAIAVSSGSVALNLALKILRNEQGERWITTPNAWCGTPNAIVNAGCTPHFADIHPETFNIELSQITSMLERSYGKIKIGGIIPVHFAGLPVHMENLYRTASKYGVKIIEDGSTALGAFWEDSKGESHTVGDCSFSDITIFSFSKDNLVTTGEGGMITTNNKEIYEKLVVLRNYGIIENSSNTRSDLMYDIIEPGSNAWLTDFQAALGISQLAKLPLWIQTRRNIAKLYNKYFYSIEGIYPQREPNYAFSARQKYVIRINFKYFNITRQELIDILASKGIETGIHFIPAYLYTFYKEKFGFQEGLFPMTEQYFEETISLPIHSEMTEDDVRYISETLIDTLIQRNVY